MVPDKLSRFPTAPAGAVSICKSLRNVAVTAAVLSAFLFFGAQIAHAETQTYKDVLRPGGVERSQAQKFADGRACGAAADNTFTNVPAFEKCMRAHGWALERITADASDVDGATFDDIRSSANGRPRSDAALQADARKCNPSGADLQTPAIKQCLLKRGWRLSFVVSKPSPAQEASASPSNPYGDLDVWVDTTGRRRGDAAARADSERCQRQTGPSLAGEETPAAVKQCMASRGWRFDHTEGRTPTYVDPETGMECRNAGIAAICGPPSGTVYYYNKHGRPCRRTGLVAICT